MSTLEALTFDLHGETFALEATLVREVLDLLPETEVPGAPAFVSAVINFRGRIIPLVDLRVAFDMPVDGATIELAAQEVVVHLVGRHAAPREGVHAHVVDGRE